MQIRPIDSSQYSAAGELTVTAYAAVDRILGDYADELRDVAGRVAAGATVLVAEEDGRVLGTVTYVPAGLDSELTEWNDPHAAGIRMLAVAPASQGKGIGRALVEACIALAHADGARRVVLHTTPSMRAAQRLYGTLGFTPASELDVQVRPDLRLIGYSLALPGEPVH